LELELELEDREGEGGVDRDFFGDFEEDWEGPPGEREESG